MIRMCPESCCPDHEPEPSRSADTVALDGIELIVEPAVAAVEAVEAVALPATVNVVLTTGHRPLACPRFEMDRMASGADPDVGRVDVVRCYCRDKRAAVIDQ